MKIDPKLTLLFESNSDIKKIIDIFFAESCHESCNLKKCNFFKNLKTNPTTTKGMLRYNVTITKIGATYQRLLMKNVATYSL